MKVLPGPTRSNQVLAWSPYGRFVVAGGNGDGIMVWDVDAGTPGQRVLKAGHGGEGMRFCPTTGRLYVAFRSGGVWTFDPATGEERQLRLLDPRTMYFSPAISPNGKTLVLRQYVHSAYPGNYSIVGFAVQEDGELTEAWSWPDGDGAAAENRSGLVFHPVTGHLFGPRGTWRETRAFEWTVADTGTLVGTLPLPVRTHVAQWALSPDGEQVAWLAQYDLSVQRLDEPAPRVLPAQGEYRRGLAWAPDSRTLAYTTGSTVRLLEAGTLSEVRTLDWGMGKARAVAFSPDGLRAAVSAEGGKGWVTVFDLE